MKQLLSFNEFQGTKKVMPIEQHEKMYGYGLSKAEYGDATAESVITYIEGYCYIVNLSNKKFALEIDRSVYIEDNLEKLEQMIYEWAIYEDYIDAEESYWDTGTLEYFDNLIVESVSPFEWKNGIAWLEDSIYNEVEKFVINDCDLDDTTEFDVLVSLNQVLYLRHTYTQEA